MGYIRNHTIVVEGWGDYIEKAHAGAVEIFGADRVSPIMGPYMNMSQSFFIPPDGSKEYWTDSDIGDARRAAFKAWLKSDMYDEDYCVKWVELSFGDEAGPSEILAGDDPLDGDEES